MYIRLKKRKTKLGTLEYAYETKCIRTKKGPRQKIKSYLGKVFHLENSYLTLQFYTSTNDLKQFFQDKKLNKIVEELLIFELVRHGFAKETNTLRNGDFRINLDDKTVKCNGNEKVVLSLNNGFLCSKTLKKCFKDMENPSETKNIIRSILLIGINSNKDIFTQIFSDKI